MVYYSPERVRLEVNVDLNVDVTEELRRRNQMSDAELLEIIAARRAS